MTLEPNPQPPPAKWRPVAAIGIVGALLAYLGLRKVDEQLIIVESIHTSGHFFFFALVAVLVAWSIPILLPDSRRRRYRFVLAFLVSVLAGALLEFAQSFLPYRSASMNDMLLDVYGALSGAAAAAIGSHFLARRRHRRQTGTNLPHRSWYRRLIAPILFVVSTYLGTSSLASCLFDYWQRDRSLPVLLSPNDSWGQRFFWVDEGLKVQRIAAGDEWPATGDQQIWELTLPSELDYPGFGVFEPSPNWSEFNELLIDVESLDEAPVELVIRIHDHHHDGHHTDRFHQQFTVVPGFQSLRLPLREVGETLPNGRKLDMAKIQGVKWFVIRPTKPWQLRFGNIRLK